jgi:hypothetical protein
LKGLVQGVSESDTDENVAVKGADLKCAYCGGDKFLEGPSGGMSTNVLCANPECRHWFNHTPIPGMELEDLHKVEPTPDDRIKTKEESDRIRAEHMRDIAKIGAEIYRQGGDVTACRQAKIPEDLRYRSTPDRCGLFARDCHVIDGFISAMADDIRKLRIRSCMSDTHA